MNREIKFRYWDPFNGCFTHLGTFKNPLDYNYKDLADFFKQLNLCESGENNPILEQYTGLKDKNGVEIYEGDIIEYTYEDDGKEKLKINWCNNSLRWKMGIYGFSSTEVGNQSRMEVINNIHQNPELLK